MLKEQISRRVKVSNEVKELMREHTDGILEYVSEQKVAWHKLARVMSKSWDEKGGRLLFKDKMILPVAATMDGDYLYVDLYGGKLNDLEGPRFIKPSQAKIFEFTDRLELLDASRLLELYTKLNEQRRSWEGVDTYDDLVKWLLVVRVAQFISIKGSVAFSVYKASIQDCLELNEGSLKDVLGKIWELVHDGVLDSDPNRQLVLSNDLKKNLGILI